MFKIAFNQPYFKIFPDCNVMVWGMRFEVGFRVSVSVARAGPG